MGPKLEREKDTKVALPEWATLSAIGSAVLYLCGYLSLRFHLSVLGIVGDLNVWDERYLFAGARFLVFTAMCLPLLGLVALGPVGLWKLLAGRISFPASMRSPELPLHTALLLAAGSIQFVFRQPLEFLGAFWKPSLPSGTWMSDLVSTLILKDNGLLGTVYMSGLLALCASTAALGYAAWRRTYRTALYRLEFGLVGVLFVLMLALLPVNYGIAIEPYEGARLAGAENEVSWLVWEGKDWLHLVAMKDGQPRLALIPAEKKERIDVAGSDRLFSEIPARRAAWKPEVRVETERSRIEAEQPVKPLTGLALLARITGVSATTRQLKGPEADAAAGQVWITPLGRPDAPRQVTKAADLRWPVMQTGTRAIFAMRGSSIVRIAGNGERVVARFANVTKLVGFDRDNASRLLVLQGSGVAILDLQTLSLTPVTVPLKERGWMMDHLRSDERVYGRTVITPRAYSAPDSGDARRDRTWSEIILAKDDSESVVVSRCDPDSCSQPSMCPDGNCVVYIRSGR